MYYNLHMSWGFLARGHTVTCFVDFYSAFDMVWRQAVVYKLYKSVLWGHLLMFVDSYHMDRVIQNLVHTHTSDWIKPLTASSMLCSCLYHIYFFLFIKWHDKNVAYACLFCWWSAVVDYTYLFLSAGSLWYSWNLSESITQWCCKWRMSNVPKTEASVLYSYIYLYILITWMDRSLYKQTQKDALGSL